MINKQTALTLKSFDKLLNKTLGERFDLFQEHFDKKIDETKQELKSEIKHLPTREQYYAREDKTMGELRKLSDEVTFIHDLYEKTNKRVNIIDKHLGVDTSTVFS